MFQQPLINLCQTPWQNSNKLTREVFYRLDANGTINTVRVAVQNELTHQVCQHARPSFIDTNLNHFGTRPTRIVETVVLVTLRSESRPYLSAEFDDLTPTALGSETTSTAFVPNDAAFRPEHFIFGGGGVTIFNSTNDFQDGPILTYQYSQQENALIRYSRYPELAERMTDFTVVERHFRLVEINDVVDLYDLKERVSRGVM